MSEVIAILDTAERPYVDDIREDYTTMDSVVIGLEIPGKRPISFADYRPLGDVSEMELDIPDDMTELLGKFFRKCYGQNPPDADWDCHSFQGYVMGWQQDGAVKPFTEAIIDPIPTEPERLRPFAGYSMLGVGQNRHSIISLPGADTLSVRGVRAPLVVANGSELMNNYSARTIHRTIYRRPVVL